MGCVSFPSLRCAVCFLINLTSFFTLILGIIGLVQAIRAKKLGYHGVIRAVGLIVSIIDIAVSALLIAVLIAALVGAGGDF